jgi:hypothetical protein
MTFKVTVRSYPYSDSKYVTVKYGDVTFDEQFLDSRDANDLASEFLDAALELNSESAENLKGEAHAEGVKECCEWLRENGYNELADKMLEDIE